MKECHPRYLFEEKRGGGGSEKKIMDTHHIEVVPDSSFTTRIPTIRADIRPLFIICLHTDLRVREGKGARYIF